MQNDLAILILGDKMDTRLDGKVALITGSSRGIGLSTARGLAQLGAEIILNGRDLNSLQEAKGLIEKEAEGAKVSIAAEDVASATG
jgi:NAD(P)-dependent dehydrogenase (short-subunit alcohol dehydrogenase family)